MKKAVFSFLALGLLAASCNFSINFKDAYEKLPTEGKTFDVKSFSAIQADGVFNIILAQGDKEGVVVKGSMPKTLKISTIGDTLVITDTSSIHIGRHSLQTDIYITFKNISDITVASVGETTCSDTLKLKRFNYTNEGVGSATLWVNTDSLTAGNDGVGKLILAGKAAYATIEDNGVGALLAKELKADVLHVNVSGVGAARVYANKELYLECSGVGGVEYSGPAKVIQSESSGVGKVEQAD